ncbi:MAG: hypothetical protein A2252_06180 [Elusimicrobia bacterium RIFOXYA2_FULL_39_19]|nr:MAG: hypothetical protein A2252_06180 [Elusimicrobia bacterium RIFOXYA2_FULL_39_19]
MFDKLKQLKKLKDLQDSLSQEKIEMEKEGVKITINGKLEVESLTLNPALDNDKQEKVLKDCLNDAIKKMQLKIAQKMAQMSGFDF